jgi:hypothetical protein
MLHIICKHDRAHAQCCSCHGEQNPPFLPWSGYIVCSRRVLLRLPWNSWAASGTHQALATCPWIRPPQRRCKIEAFHPVPIRTGAPIDREEVLRRSSPSAAVENGPREMFFLVAAEKNAQSLGDDVGSKSLSRSHDTSSESNSIKWTSLPQSSHKYVMGSSKNGSQIQPQFKGQLKHCSLLLAQTNRDADHHGPSGRLHHGRPAVCLLEVEHPGCETKRAETPRSRWRTDQLE